MSRNWVDYKPMMMVFSSIADAYSHLQPWQRQQGYVIATGVYEDPSVITRLPPDGYSYIRAAMIQAMVEEWEHVDLVSQGERSELAEFEFYGDDDLRDVAQSMPKSNCLTWWLDGEVQVICLSSIVTPRSYLICPDVKTRLYLQGTLAPEHPQATL